MIESVTFDFGGTLATGKLDFKAYIERLLNYGHCLGHSAKEVSLKKAISDMLRLNKEREKNLVRAQVCKKIKKMTPKGRDMPNVLLKSKGLLSGMRKIKRYPPEIHISMPFKTHMKSGHPKLIS